MVIDQPQLIINLSWTYQPNQTHPPTWSWSQLFLQTEPYLKAKCISPSTSSSTLTNADAKPQSGTAIVLQSLCKDFIDFMVFWIFKHNVESKTFQ